MSRKDIVKLNEHKFQIAYTMWEMSGYKDKASYNRMFLSMNFAAKNMIKKEAAKKGIYIDADAKALDLTCLIFNRDIIGKHIRPERLSSYLYLPMIGIMYGHQLQFEERCSSYEGVIEKHDIPETKADTEVIDILKEEKKYDTGKQIVSEQDIQDPDTVMKLFGWEYHD